MVNSASRESLLRFLILFGTELGLQAWLPETALAWLAETQRAVSANSCSFFQDGRGCLAEPCGVDGLFPSGAAVGVTPVPDMLWGQDREQAAGGRITCLFTIY